MSNQLILWSTLIIPWFSLLFMKKEDIKRFAPAGLLAGFLSIVVSEMGVANGWWFFRETTYPFALMSTYTYGLFPILPMWILKYTYGHFWHYAALEIALNAFFAFLFLPWVDIRGILYFNAGLIAFILASVIALVVYGFQIWEEGIFKRSQHSMNLHPAAAKPLSKYQNNNKKDNHD